MKEKNFTLKYIIQKLFEFIFTGHLVINYENTVIYFMDHEVLRIGCVFKV